MSRWLRALVSPRQTSTPNPSAADTDALQDSWSVDEAEIADADGFNFFPRLSLVGYQDDEPTWCLPVEPSPGPSTSPSPVSASEGNRVTRNQGRRPRIAIIGDQIRSSDDSGLPSCGDDASEDVEMDAVNRDWPSLHCHLNNHSDNEAGKRAQKQLIMACCLCLIFMVGEAVGGFLSNSLAVMTDAAHMMSDFASFLISLFAIWLGKQKPSKRMSFGYYRAEALGALASIVIIWIVSGVLVYMAVLRLLRGNFKIEPDTMIIVAAVGVLVNVILGFVLHGLCHSIPHNHHHHHHHHNDHHHGSSPRKEDGTVVVVNGHEEGGSGRERRKVKQPRNINVRAAFIHVLGDLVQSIGVLIAAFIIHYKPEWKVADPICTFLFSGLVILTTVGVLRDTIMVLMESTPKYEIDVDAVKRDIMSVPGVRSYHEFHIWSLTVGKHGFTTHVTVDETANPEAVLSRIIQKLRIHHPSIISSTVQVERHQDAMNGCKLCSSTT